MYVVIIAGGIGARFWPRSRQSNPKQLLNILSNTESMIQSTVKRMNSLVSNKHIYIVTNENQMQKISDQLPYIPEENILIEPIGKNTAPCIGLAAFQLHRKDPEGVMVILPADHLIRKEGRLRELLKFGENVAVKYPDSLVTIGIKPTRPETGYGYIQCGEEIVKKVFKVKSFAEKPNYNTAKRFLKSGDFLWNSGIFIWRVQTILKEIEMQLPELYDGLLKIENAFGTSKYSSVLDRVYHQIHNISIDYGVMEKAKKVFVLKGNFEWNDIGSWLEVYKLSKKDKKGNVNNGKYTFALDTESSFIHAPDKLVATIGIKDLIVIDTGDAILICNKNKSQDVKKIVEYLKRKKLNEYL